MSGIRMWTGFKWIRIGDNGGLLSTGNEASSSIKCGTFIDQMNSY